ncbi:DUF6545 domain-containing protein [Streptomyces sp. NPDC001553]|uniref:DUF6545 domain-containing protein n=1 Tax=Streptomyces sp. NPDC001553 TaxID=3154385 RepID=UPI00332140D5
MSEHTANIVYLAIVMVASCTTIAKLAAWRRERSTALALITTCSTIGVAAFLIATPLVWRGIAEFTGSANIAELAVFFCILAFFALTHVMSLLWQPSANTASSRDRLAGPAGIYCVIAVAIVAGFATGDLDDAPHPMDFNLAYGQDAGALLMLASFQLGLAYASVFTASRFLRHAASSQGDPRLSRALKHISLATWFIFGYVACVTPATIAGAVGVHSLDALHSLGPVSGTIGALIINWGFSGAAIATWRADRRDYLALAPLWQLTRRADPRIALNETNKVADLGLLYVRDWHLVTRMGDILSSVRSLYGHFSEEPVMRIGEQTKSWRWSPEDELAAAAAALILRAVALAEANTEPGSETGQTLPGGELEPSAQRRHLVKVAGFLDHPRVLSAAGLDATGQLVAAP